MLSFSFTVTISLRPRDQPHALQPSENFDAHFITIPENGAYPPFNGVSAFVAQVTRDYISHGAAATLPERALGISLGEGNRTPVALEDGSPSLQSKWFRASRLATTRIPRARVVESGREVRFGRHDNIHSLTERIRYLERVGLGNLCSDEGVSLGVGFGDGIKLIIVGRFFFRIASVVRVGIALGLVIGNIGTPWTPGGFGIGFGVRLGERTDIGRGVTCAGAAKVKGRHAPRAQGG